MNIQFVPLTKENEARLLGLEIYKSQKGFVEDMSDSIELAKENQDWKAVGIYDDSLLVGFALYGKWKDEVWLDRFLISKDYQGRGYGKNSLSMMITYLKNAYNPKNIYLSVFKENTKAIGLYQNFGFKFDGRLDTHGEMVMELAIN